MPCKICCIADPAMMGKNCSNTWLVLLLCRGHNACMREVTTVWLLVCRQHEGITSAMLIACQLVRHAPHHCQEHMLGPLVAAMWPWTMWHHHAIRSAALL